MARIRTIKPEFWSSEQVMGLSRDARLLFIGLWNFCDDAGIHPASAPTIKALVLPGDDITLDSVAGMMQELIAAELLTVYEVAGKKYWKVTGWKRHQRIDQATYKYPKEDGNITQTPPRRRSDTQTVQQVFDEHSANVRQVFIPGEEGNGHGKEGNLIPLSDDRGCAQAKPDPLPACPHEKLKTLYAEKLPMLPQPRTWDGQRATNMRNRWKWVLTEKCKNESEALAFFARFFDYVRESDFLMGRTGSWQGCDLPWLMKAENFAKVIDGKYENRGGA